MLPFFILSRLYPLNVQAKLDEILSVVQQNEFENSWKDYENREVSSFGEHNIKNIFNWF